MSHPRPILVDDRIGSKDLLEPLRDIHLPAYPTQLEYGDVAFEGHGPSGPVMVGIERKRITDLISSKRSGRLAGHQLGGLLRDYQVVYLLVEGAFRPNPNSGVLEVPGRGGWDTLRLGSTGFAFSELEGFLVGLENKCNIKIRCTYNRAQSVAWIQTMWTWWGVEWDAHQSLDVVYTPPPPTVQFVKPSFERRVAAQLEGVGWDKSAAIAAKFESVIEMAAAEEKQWLEVPGIGKTLAKRIVGQFRNQKEVSK